MVAALAFEYFARRRVDIAVIETGLGGRLDATNVLEPILTIVTDISVDHAEILGPTIADIAREKAGIIKAGVPTITGLLRQEAAGIIKMSCREKGSELIRLSRRDFRIDLRRQRLDFQSDGLRITGLTPALYGSHQLRNCAVVLKAIGSLRKNGVMINRSQAIAGLTSTRWPGRFQIVENGTGLPTVILDVCHNSGGVAAFVDTFARLFPGRKAELIAGFVRRKPHQEMVDLLASVASGFWLVPLRSNRSTDVKELQATLHWHGLPVRSSARLVTARNRLLKRVGPDDIIAVVGSHYLVGEYLSKYGNG